MAADLFETYAVTAVAAMLLAYLFWPHVTAAVTYPLLLGGASIIASIIGTFFVRLGGGSTNIMNALYKGLGIAALIAIALFYPLTNWMLGAQKYRDAGIPSVSRLFLCAVSGIVVTALIVVITEYFTATRYNPVKSIAKASLTGHATNIIQGLAVSMQSTALPVLVIAAGILASYEAAGGGTTAGLYGIAVAVMAMLSMTGIIVAIDAYGPITDNAGGADRVALGDGLGGVADRVEWIGGVARFFRQVGHLSDAAGVVGDGAVGVEGDDDAGHGEQGHDGHGDAVQAGGSAATGRFVAGEDAGGDDQHRQSRGLHGHGEALDDVGGVAGEARLGDALHRVVARRREVLGDDDDEGGHDDTADRAQEQPADAGDAGVTVLLGAEHPVGERVEERDGDESSDAEALVEGVHDTGAAAAEAHEERADDRGDD